MTHRVVCNVLCLCCCCCEKLLLLLICGTEVRGYQLLIFVSYPYLFNTRQIYTVSRKKRLHFYFFNNSVKC